MTQIKLLPCNYNYKYEYKIVLFQIYLRYNINNFFLIQLSHWLNEIL